MVAANMLVESYYVMRLCESEAPFPSVADPGAAGCGQPATAATPLDSRRPRQRYQSVMPQTPAENTPISHAPG